MVLSKKNGRRADEYVCFECGGLMKKADDTVLVCTKCGYSVDIDDYGCENDYNEYYSTPQNEILAMPECCRACGGPYPSCMTSCKIFDD